MDLATWEILALVLAGLVGGFINVMAGGGSVIMVPVMIFLGVPGPIANGTNRLPILIQNFTACITYFRHGLPQSRMIVSLSLCAIPGAVLGALVGVRLSAEGFNHILAAVMIAVLLLMILEPRADTQNTHRTISRQRLIAGHGLMMAAGFWGGFIQIGMGFILLPIMTRVLGFTLVAANVHKVFIIFTYTASALLVFGSQVPLLWWVGGIMAIGNGVGGWLGARLTIAGGERIVKIAVVIAIAVMVIKLIWFT